MTAPTYTTHNYTFDLDGAFFFNAESSFYWMAVETYKDEEGSEPNVVDFKINERTSQFLDVTITVRTDESPEDGFERGVSEGMAAYAAGLNKD